jgi:diguanylate cyclase (GGDEF)-like protein
LINDSAAQAIGKPSDQLVGQLLDDWPWQQPDDWQPPWTTTLHSGLKLSDQALRLELENGETRVLVASCATVGNAEDGVRGVLVTLDDMTAIEQKNTDLAMTLQELRSSQESIHRKNKELEALATQDPLTGLANRRALMTNFEHEYAKALREPVPLSCIMADIDHFKLINDTHGHGVGDEVICAVANTMVGECREYDTVGRYGGEEFVIVLPGLSTEEAIEVAERIRLKVTLLIRNPSIPLDTLSASFGVNTVNASSTSVLQMLEQADEALYVAKQGGRNRVVSYDADTIALSSPPTDELSNELSNELIEQTQIADSNLSRVIELEAMVQQRSRDLEHLREYDALTGIPKRTLFLQRIDTEVLRAERLKLNIGTLSMEIKELNRIVSTFGHKASDALVVEFVSRLQEGLRTTDMVSEIMNDHSMSLLTTNEYGVLLSDLDDSAQAMPVITRLRRLLSTPFEVEGQKIYLGVNIGISLYPQGGSNAVELMDSAGQARAEASLKPEKISHCFASESLEKVSREYITLEADLYEAYEKSQFEVYFQPKFDLALRRVKSMEALLRWQHPEKGLISPDRFIPVAEANGLIHDLSDFVLGQCLNQITQWNSMGLGGMQISINVSPLQIRDPNLVSNILSAMNTANIPTSQIEIELTETSVFESPQRARVALNRMRDAGLSIAMDDFGTGYTSLGQLADLPMDVVKIDRSFVIAMGTSERSRAIIESVINMAHALKLRVIAEGVETNEQLALLSGLGCNEIQGYLISRPLPATDITDFLLRQDKQRLSA